MRRIVVLLLLSIAVASCGDPLRRVHMDGGQGDVINLWDTYQNQETVTGTARSGEEVTLLRQEDAGCYVETDANGRGWVTCANFIQEFK
jgi:hypothetical protein